MQALYVWLGDKLNKQLVGFCRDAKEKKAWVVRQALANYLKFDGEVTDVGRKGIEVAGNVPNVSENKQQSS